MNKNREQNQPLGVEPVVQGGLTTPGRTGICWDGGDEDVVMKFLRSLKLPGMLLFVTGTVWLAGWQQQTSARIDRGFVLEPKRETRLLLSQYPPAEEDSERASIVEDQ